MYDFNYLGRTFQVLAQGDEAFRQTPEDITRFKARNSSGEMVPLGSVATLNDQSAPYRVPRYNLYPAADVMGAAEPGVSSGTAMTRMADLAKQVLPPGITFEWTDLAHQQEQQGVPTLADLRRLRRLRVPRAGGAVRELEAAAGESC
jgi:multidrug efflux pump subunit AcrB